MRGTVWLCGFNVLNNREIFTRIVTSFDVETVDEFKERAELAYWPQRDGLTLEFGPIGESWQYCGVARR